MKAVSKQHCVSPDSRNNGSGPCDPVNPRKAAGHLSATFCSSGVSCGNRLRRFSSVLVSRPQCHRAVWGGPAPGCGCMRRSRPRWERQSGARLGSSTLVHAGILLNAYYMTLSTMVFVFIATPVGSLGSHLGVLLVPVMAASRWICSADFMGPLKP